MFYSNPCATPARGLISKIAEGIQYTGCGETKSTVLKVFKKKKKSARLAQMRFISFFSVHGAVLRILSYENDFGKIPAPGGDILTKVSGTFSVRRPCAKHERRHCGGYIRSECSIVGMITDCIGVPE